MSAGFRRTANRFPRALVVAAAIAAASLPLAGQATRKLTTFKDLFGFDIGDDYQMANVLRSWREHWKKLATESDRVKLVEIGHERRGTADQYMAII